MQEPFTFNVCGKPFVVALGLPVIIHRFYANVYNVNHFLNIDMCILHVISFFSKPQEEVKDGWQSRIPLVYTYHFSHLSTFTVKRFT